MSTAKPVVSYAGPIMMADHALEAAYDLLERKRFGEGVEKLGMAVAAINQAVEFIVANHPEAP